jgi:hypothetical protein
MVYTISESTLRQWHSRLVIVCLVGEYAFCAPRIVLNVRSSLPHHRAARLQVIGLAKNLSAEPEYRMWDVRSLERGNLFRRQLHSQCGYRVLEMVRLAGADDGGGDCRSGKKPGER